MMTDQHAPTKTDLHDRVDHARDAAAEAVAASREKVTHVAHRAAEGLEANPLGVVIGGLAVGALVGALLPRSDREKALLAPAGKRLGESARAAVQAAREAGYAELDQRGLTRHAAKDQAKGVIDGLGQALSSAGTAAAGAARSKGGATTTA